jgi:hypothetical protein
MLLKDMILFLEMQLKTITQGLTQLRHLSPKKIYFFPENVKGNYEEFYSYTMEDPSNSRLLFVLQ